MICISIPVGSGNDPMTGARGSMTDGRSIDDDDRASMNEDDKAYNMIVG